MSGTNERAPNSDHDYNGQAEVYLMKFLIPFDGRPAEAPHLLFYQNNKNTGVI